ncbi:hypothetical protein [Chryseobacterium sp. CFBP8996]|uniref:hypothetical protein n=1 Tax=Chryseobacterium sp. CFBP8996 TaxID=3096529 RepID=UPI002A6B546E|nr:hypothetical protein [Chryseobacterium sp. CFBP8996]MDY0930735.1 hypothetical protein [Chryseobacterium sp. CFBP8996]
MQYINISLPKIVTARDIHVRDLFQLIKDRVARCEDDNVFNFLTDKKIKKILNDDPEHLHTLQVQFFENVIPNFSIRDRNDYANITRTKNFTQEELRLKGIFDNIYKELERIFNYENFLQKKVRTYCAYSLADNLDIPTCVYCNRIYTKTVSKTKKITRPTFDHWYPKSKYPMLALSFYNLIPSCYICNSGVKGDIDFNLDSHFHPYNFNPDFKYTFSYDHKDYSKFSFKIVTEPEDSFSEKSVKAFELEEIYKAHEDEIEDLRHIRDAYTEDYISLLENQILKMPLDRKDVYRLAFGVHYDDSKFDRRPLSKMKKDILKELGIKI